jgi:Type II CAAX prenyl endopeptidase Rce1-like
MFDFSFIRKPNLEIEKNITFKQKLKEMFFSFLFLYAFVTFSLILMKFLDLLIFEFYRFSIMDQITNQQNNSVFRDDYIYTAFKILILAPIIEEVIFRLPLNLNKITIGVSLSMLSLLYVGDSLLQFSVHLFSSWIKVIAIFFTILFCYFFIPKKGLNIIKSKYFYIYFYLITICFGLVHITNFKIDNYYMCFLYIPFILPQFFLGFFTGYIRIKNGFLWCVLMHFIFNIPAAILFMIKNY